jgi:outer membrane protein TolC
VTVRERLGGGAAALVLLLSSGSAKGQGEVSEPDAPPTMALSDAVNQALARNLSAVVAFDEVRRAEALLEQTRSSALPTLYGNASYTRLDNDRVLQGNVIAASANQVSANVVLTVPVFAPKLWAQWSHASDTIDVARVSAIDVRRMVAVAVARAYLTIVAQRRVIDAATRARDTDRAHYEFAHQRLMGGVGNRLDEVRAEQQLHSDEASVEQAYTRLAEDCEALGVLVGVGGPLDAQEPNLQVTMDPLRAMRDAEHRTDVIAADLRVRSAEHTMRDDWTDYAPYVTAVVQPFYQNPPTLTLPLTGWQAQLVLSIPFYDGGLRYGQAKERGVVRDEARAQLDATVRQARSDVRTAFQELRRADAALAAARLAAQLGHQALDLAEMAYRAGAYTNLEVIDAQRTARDADTAVAVAEDGARQARLDILAATGRFP